MTMGLNPYRGPEPYALAPLAAPAIPGMPGIAVTGSASEAAVQPEPSSGAVDEANVAGAAEDQLAGTERPPTAPAPPSPAEIPPPPTELAELASAPSAPAAAPATSLAAAAGVAAARVWLSDTAVGMAVIVNQAPVFTPPLMALKTEGVPRKPSIDCRRLLLIGKVPAKLMGLGPLIAGGPKTNASANVWAGVAALATAAPCTAGAAGFGADVSGATG